MVPVLLFAVILCAVQLLQGTKAIFSLCCFFYVLVAAYAFNVAGGFTRTSGAFIFFNAVLTVILGVCMKAYLGEAADSNLLSPLLTIRVYLSCMCMMCMAAYLTRKFATKRALLGKMVTDSNMQTATVGCLIAGILMSVAVLVIPSGSGSVLSALNQLNRFFPMAIILGVINSIRRSGGTRSINPPILISGSLMFLIGVFGFSKEGMIAPFACWLIAAASQRYKMSRWQLAGIVLGTIFLFRYLVPYAQYGRNFRDEDSGISISTSLYLLSNLEYVREQYLEMSAFSYEERVSGYYNTPQGFFDRLQMVAIDDALIDNTERFGTFGIYPLVASFENLVPHFIWKDKPAVFFGNVYAHQIGMLAPDDDSTGISFSPASDAFHEASWYGIFIWSPLMFFLLFVVFDSICGDVRKTPWGILVMVLYAHMAPEGGLGGITYMLGYTTLGILFAAVMGSYAMPLLGTLFIGPEGIQLRRGAPIQSVPNRLRMPFPSKADPTQAS
jgi:hypothetical protein